MAAVIGSGKGSADTIASVSIATMMPRASPVTTPSAFPTHDVATSRIAEAAIRRTVRPYRKPVTTQTSAKPIGFARP